MKRLGCMAGAIALSGIGALFITATAAEANDPSCTSYGFSSKNGGNAWANGCKHRGSGEKTRLRADCESSPFHAYSPTVTGSFTNMNFSTESCKWGVNGSVLQHNW